MNGFEAKHPRRDAGAPAGGQFVRKPRSEPDVSLVEAPGLEPGVDDVVELAQAEAAALLAGELDDSDRDLQACRAVPEADERVVREMFFRPLVDAYRGEAGGDPDLGARAREVAGALSDFVARERRWQADTTFVAPRGAARGRAAQGPAADRTASAGHFGTRDVVSVAGDVRGDLRDAVRAGYLPAGLTFSVRCSTPADGRAMDVAIRGLSDEQVWGPDRFADFRRQYTESARLVRERVAAIANNYNPPDASTEADHRRGVYYVHVALESDRMAAAA